MEREKMTKQSRLPTVFANGDHRPSAVHTSLRIAADRDAFIAAPDDSFGGRELRFLGFTRADWMYAGAPKHYLGYNHESPHPDLLFLCGMAQAVDRWRRAAASQYEGEHGPIPEFWNMPDLVAQWELANPGRVTARKAHAAEREHKLDQTHLTEQPGMARRNGKAVSGRVSAGRR